MAKRPKFRDRWHADRHAYINYPLTRSGVAIMRLAYYLGARAAVKALSDKHRDKGLEALKAEIEIFLLAAGIHE